MGKAALELDVKVAFGMLLPSALEMYLVVGLLVHTRILVSRASPYFIPQSVYSFTSPPAVGKGSVSFLITRGLFFYRLTCKGVWSA